MKHPTKNDSKSDVTLRAVLIGLALVPINVYIVVQWETVWNTQYPTTMTIFYNVVFTFLSLILLNMLLKRWLPRIALSQQELLTVYTMLFLAVCVSGHDFSQSIFLYAGHCPLVCDARERLGQPLLEVSITTTDCK